MTESNKTVKVPVLTRIQNELKAPKSQWNDYGKYHYRNAEDIMSGLKPLLMKYGALLYFGDALVDKANQLLTVYLHYNDGELKIDKEIQLQLEPHKGMTPEQANGAALSYAKKYALCDLLLIDDGQDFDAMDNRQAGYKSRNQQPSNGYQRRQTPQQKQLHDQASAMMDEAANIKRKAEATVVDSSGTSLLDLCKQSKQEGGKGPAHQRIEAWIAEDPKLSTSKHNFVKRIGELNIV